MWNALLDLIYPPNIKCIICNRSLKIDDQYGFCEECYQDIRFIGEDCCDKCSKPFNKSVDMTICQDCIKQEHFFHRAVSAVEYYGKIKKLIFSFKYHDATYLAKYMGDMMIEVFQREELTADIIMAVPIHSIRQRNRGYNQAHLLAKYISKELGIDYYKGYLIRVKNTEVLYNLTKHKRKKIMQDAFEIGLNKDIRHKEILLIDDIYTTGTTVNHCSKVLIEAGAKEVTVLTFARGI